jgi:chromosome partitioning protein
MKIITVAHQKGGVGKSTLTLNLAACLKNSGLKVAILDTDAQGSLAGTNYALKGIDFVGFEELSNVRTMTYDILVIDTPPYLTNSLGDLFGFSDYVLIPTTIGIYDVLAIRSTLAIIAEVQKTRPQLKYGVVLNRVRSGTNLINDIVEMLDSYKATVLKTRIHERVSYARSALTNGIFGTDDSKAQEEIMSLTSEIINDIK